MKNIVGSYLEALLPNGKSMQLWGMTELQAGTYSRPGDTAEQRRLTTGFATPGNEIRIVDEDGTIAETGIEGEVQIRGASVFSGYYNNADANR